MTTFKPKDRAYHKKLGPCTVWAVCSEGILVGIKTDAGNIHTIHHKSLVPSSDKDHWVSNATNLLINGGMEAVYEALATGALPVPERQYQPSDIFVGTLEADSHPEWTADRLYAVCKPSKNSSLWVIDDEGVYQKLDNLVRQGVLAFHHRP